MVLMSECATQQIQRAFGCLRPRQHPIETSKRAENSHQLSASRGEKHLQARGIERKVCA
jgi:hypothetical protein